MTEQTFPVQHSPYLQSIQKTYPHVDEVINDPIAVLKGIIKNIESTDTSLPFDEIEQQLIQTKAEFAWAWSYAELMNAGEFSERGELQTQFAESSIDVALAASWQKMAAKHAEIRKQLELNHGRMPGLFVLGLGKLGGFDLNFSSDADLIAYFDPDVLPVPPTLGAGYVCHQVLQTLTRLLGQGGASNFVWRVDWRLRPNASATTLAMSTVAASDYYFYKASPWHRLALMKARVIAGDKEVGQEFLTSLTPFIWRQNLDYRALDELGEIKTKIKQEHPSLRSERNWVEPVNEDVVGFNVKLGTGGIREVEFIANALQLVWGGKHSALQTPNTLKALAALEQNELLSSEAVQELSDAYRYLRRVENALQILANQQTHSIPQSEQNQQALLALLKIDSWSALVEQINAHRNKVNVRFESLFAEQVEASGPPIEWPDGLSEPVQDIVDDWERGFLNYGVNRDMRPKLRPLLRGLATSLSQADAPEDVALRLHEFFRSLPQGEQYFRLLAESPPLLERMIQPLQYSPVMSGLLKQSPHIVDCFLHADSLDIGCLSEGRCEFDSAYVVDSKNYETKLERLRRFVNEQLYQLYLGFIQGELTPPTMFSVLTQLAQHTLDLSLEIVANDLGLPEVPVTVIGMGKMGVGRMAPQSDMDLIFVFDPDRSDLNTATKYVSRFQTAVSTPMREGVVYELDTRLRPSGRSGAPTVSIESFRNHQLQRARNWEHIALVSASVVGGAMHLKPEINAIKREVLDTPRDQQQFLYDAKKMWHRIAEHRIKPVAPETMLSKLRLGGLMQTEYMAACRVLMDCKVDDSLHFYDRLKILDGGQQTFDRISFWQSLQLWERLLGWSDNTVRDIPKPFQSAMLKHLDLGSMDDLVAKQAEIETEVLRGSEAFFADIPQDWDVDEWNESAIQWLN